MKLIELSDYTLAPIGQGNGLNQFYFDLSKGDVCSIQADLPDDAHLLLKAIAMLEHPTEGAYRFMGKKINFSDQRNLLPYKKKIGYITIDASMISNMSIRENLLLMRYYFENSLSLDIKDNVKNLCAVFDIYDKLDMRPGELRPTELRSAIVIRELAKSPDILLFERPEDFIRHEKFDLFVKLFKEMLLAGLPVVFISYHTDFVKEFSNRNILISGGNLMAS
ncbi:MAG: ATP-binding cassette domain-containing protein [Desulfobacterales bacterium]|uniref:ATP-binding cassette domain-containing protein n=1 Tax=Candidatus Desulfaltia bathyphila TaxID=2841697 RepID=A0A8J6N5Y3_9BACT|nr:ATP-binding cassette domain-containing protein [Candidatus Desulfaltia bathyphila]MBL7196105.1 ATP-binding cassette domain-containing protein [Desulfobacterales bacterium]MBL7207374.1 ATP-binding cassette domain-containing protein [Desulfobacterales bacterium]